MLPKTSQFGDPGPISEEWSDETVSVRFVWWVVRRSQLAVMLLPLQQEEVTSSVL